MIYISKYIFYLYFQNISQAQRKIKSENICTNYVKIIIFTLEKHESIPRLKNQTYYMSQCMYSYLYSRNLNKFICNNTCIILGESTFHDR